MESGPRTGRTCLSLEEKSQLITEFENGTSQLHLSIIYNLAKSTVSSIIKKKEEIMAQNDRNLGKMKKLRSPKSSEMEKKLMEWLKLNYNLNQPVNGDKIRVSIVIVTYINMSQFKLKF